LNKTWQAGSAAGLFARDFSRESQVKEDRSKTQNSPKKFIRQHEMK
jgi:hypothetical protein